MTFNNKCQFHHPGLNPVKRGRPQNEIVFEKNSTLFDDCSVNPNWIDDDIKRWAKFLANKTTQKDHIQDLLKDIERKGDAIDLRKVSLNQKINELR